MKNYIGMVNDHSGSMNLIRQYAIRDYNSTIKAIADTALQDRLDTIVSTVGIGFRSHYPSNGSVKRQVVISNPNVLREIDSWACEGGTPLYDGIGDLIDLFESLPDTHNPDVSFLVLVTTDGYENASSIWDRTSLKARINRLKASGRWTFTARIPNNAPMGMLLDVGFEAANIQTWEQTEKGMAAATEATTQALRAFSSSRVNGQKSSSSFYSNASDLNLAKLDDVTSKVSLYVVPPENQGIEIRDFVLKHRMEYLKGAAFYQLTKTEAKVSHTKQVLVRDQATGKIFAGKEARKMIGLPDDRNARLHPGDHAKYDIFIQSESVNRKLVGGSGVVYWKEIGVPFTEADLAYLKPKEEKAEVTKLIPVPKSSKPTKSPIPVTPKREYFETREEARTHCRDKGLQFTVIEQHKENSKKFRWSAPSR